MKLFLQNSATCGVALILAASTLSAAALTNEPAVFRDPAQPLEKRIQDLVGRLTLEEKAMLLDHKGPAVELFNVMLAFSVLFWHLLSMKTLFHAGVAVLLGKRLFGNNEARNGN